MRAPAQPFGPGRPIEEQWNSETRSSESAVRERYINVLFDTAELATLLNDAECRVSLCRLDMDAKVRGLNHPGMRVLAGKLGRSAAVLVSDSERVVVLVPAGDLTIEREGGSALVQICEKPASSAAFAIARGPTCVRRGGAQASRRLPLPPPGT